MPFNRNLQQLKNRQAPLVTATPVPPLQQFHKANKALNISPDLQRKVYELHLQIRKELGDVKYALMGKGMVAVLCGVENQDIETICPELANHREMPRFPANPRRYLDPYIQE